MNKFEAFVEQFDWLVANCKTPVVLTDDVKEIRQQILEQGLAEKNKPLFTKSGLKILEYLQGVDGKNFKAKDIALGMNVSSREVSGAIRKLVTDGYIQKFGQNPVIYNLTEQGKTFDIKDYKEKMNNEENND